MSSTDQAAEPTMDEILASIRKIIADDPAPENAQPQDTVEDDVFDLSDALIAESHAPAAQSVPFADASPQPAPDNIPEPPSMPALPEEAMASNGVHTDVPEIDQAIATAAQSLNVAEEAVPAMPTDMQTPAMPHDLAADEHSAQMEAALAGASSTSAMPTDFSRDVEAALENAALMPEVSEAIAPQATAEETDFSAAQQETVENMAASALRGLDTQGIQSAMPEMPATPAEEEPPFQPSDPLAGLPEIIQEPFSEEERAATSASSEAMIAGMSAVPETPPAAPVAAAEPTEENPLKSSLLQNAVMAQLSPSEELERESAVEEIIADAEPAAAATEMSSQMPTEDLAAVEQTPAASAAHPPADTVAQPEAGQEPRTLEQSIQELLKPMLREWLDDNMPRIVEGVVKSEMKDNK